MVLDHSPPDVLLESVPAHCLSIGRPGLTETARTFQADALRLVTPLVPDSVSSAMALSRAAESEICSLAESF
jgi:hypothetical protein